MSDVGVWLVGARGNIAVTTMVGARALARGATDATGMVTARPPCSTLDLPDPEGLVFGGHDVRTGSVEAVARRRHESDGVPDGETLDAVAPDLAAIDERVRPGSVRNCGEAVRRLADGFALDEDRSAAALVERFRDDYATFARQQDLDGVVVVNVASTEPPLADPGRYDSAAAFERAVEADDPDLPASALYAYAAIDAGHPYVNFTPSTGASLEGLRELADERGVPQMGNDGKTGESLVKSALGPMFAGRNLRVLSWEAHNILGNTDGEVLEDDRNKEGKLASKGDILDGILPDLGHERVRIDHTPSLGDWKTAWDHVHFEGFLDTEMTMQFTWRGSDSALAAPLILDLARLVAYADERGEGGLQPHLASFFKAPMGVDEQDFSRQFDLLAEYAAARVGEEPVESTPTD